MAALVNCTDWLLSNAGPSDLRNNGTNLLPIPEMAAMSRYLNGLSQSRTRDMPLYTSRNIPLYFSSVDVVPSACAKASNDVLVAQTIQSVLHTAVQGLEAALENMAVLDPDSRSVRCPWVSVVVLGVIFRVSCG